ncbi:DUF2786 domain-containing protein [Eoetvoesiella caeni]
MADEKILQKIKKCLALSKSANEHEAANALRQAHALMRIHQIEHSDVLASVVSETQVRSRSINSPSRWENTLVRAICAAFTCEALFIAWKAKKEAYWTFIGESANPEVAGYAYQVIHRQVRAGRREYLSNSCKDYPRKIKNRMVDLFSVAWVEALERRINEFAKPDDYSDALKAYMDKNYAQLDGEVKPRSLKVKGKLKPYEMHAVRSGFDAANSTKLHHGVPTKPQTLLEHS